MRDEARHEDGAWNPLAAIARVNIAAQLRRALELVEDEAFDDATELCDALSEASEQAEALLTVDAAIVGSEHVASPWTMTALAIKNGEPPGEFLLIPFGDVRVERPLAGGSFEFTRAHADAATHWFEQLGRKLVIDYEHQSFDRLNTRPDGLRPAAGWIGKLEAREDGLWATDVTWTGRATELLRSGEYRYFSPVIYWSDAEYTELSGLGPVALTNDPAMHGVKALAGRRAAEKPIGVRATDDRAGEIPAPRDHENPANADVGILRAQLAEREADAFVERGLRLGKIVEATRGDWRGDFLRDAAEAELRLGRAPVVLPPGRVMKLDARRVTSADSARERGSIGSEIEAADLDAFERAVAAGRVQLHGSVA